MLGVLAAGLGESVSDAERQFWLGTYRANHTAVDGRHRLRTATVNLRDRDGLEARLDGVTGPVLWLQGTADHVYPDAEDGISRFTRSPSAELHIDEGGQHFFTASDPDTANTAAPTFVYEWSCPQPRVEASRRSG